ncbi:putative PRONE domain, Rop guanine nucleotide exchange factor [Helianthus debilis subsp. tardiflorus]
MMKERFAKLLLGEDMSGSGKGVSWLLFLMPSQIFTKMMWKRETNCLLSVYDYIVEFIPMSHSLQNGKAM